MAHWCNVEPAGAAVRTGPSDAAADATGEPAGAAASKAVILPAAVWAIGAASEMVVPKPPT